MTEVANNTAAGRYELVEADQLAYADYRLQGDVLIIDYVFSPPELRGTGTAGRLMQGLVNDVRARGLKITPLCGYAATWLRRHREAVDLLA
jgi:predicted GNAT family acetyltransferase